MPRREPSAACLAKLAPCPAAGVQGAGFTIVEVLMTMLLLMVVMLGLTALQLTTIRQVTNSKLASEATRLAQLALEHYQTIEYANVVDTGGVWSTEMQRDGVTPMQGVSADGQGDGPFTVRAMIESPPGGGSRLITIRVSWLSVERGAESAPAEQYRELGVTMSLQRYR